MKETPADSVPGLVISNAYMTAIAQELEMRLVEFMETTGLPASECTIVSYRGRYFPQWRGAVPTQKVLPLGKRPAVGPGESSTYGDLWYSCPYLVTRVEPHEWDNMSVWQQRDFVLRELRRLSERVRP